MPRDDDRSLGDQNTFGDDQHDLEVSSLGDEATFADEQSDISSASLGDEVTFDGGGASAVGLNDDGMETQDLTARYTIEGVLGKGGMGEVLLATDSRLNRKVAIKRMLGKATRSQTAVSRFLTEAQAIASLNHPNIVQIYDYGRDNKGPFLIMEFVEGRSLLDRLQEGAIPLEEAVEMACQLCEGLGKAHAANIIHRDIKPANVLLTGDGVPKLTDFGLAKDKAADTGMTMAGAVLGTLDFMPPEQRRDAALTDARSDIWSLAATLYQMITGKSPKIIKFNAVPESLQDVLGKALEDDKDDRYQTTSEMRDALKASLRQSAPVFAPNEELGAGECSLCHTRNESSRKFCRECAASLRVDCLQCEANIPIWDKVCGECGGKQPELIAARIEHLQQQRDQAERLRSEFHYESALQIAQEIASGDDDRVAQLAPWANDFLESAKAEWAQQQKAARQHIAEAMKHQEAFDYQAAIHAIQAIPDPMRDGGAKSFLKQLESAQKESRDLIQTIEERIKGRDLDGLLEQVERALDLQGNREDLHRLRGQLLDREGKLATQRDEAFKKARQLIMEGKAKTALDLLQRVRSKQLTAPQESFKREIEVMVAAEDELVALLNEAKLDGVIDPEEILELLPRALECLKLNPSHIAIRKLRDDLLERLQKIPDDTLALAVLRNLLGPQHIEHGDAIAKATQLPNHLLESLPSQVRSRVEAWKLILDASDDEFHLTDASDDEFHLTDLDADINLAEDLTLAPLDEFHLSLPDEVPHPPEPDIVDAQVVPEFQPPRSTAYGSNTCHNCGRPGKLLVTSKGQYCSYCGVDCTPARSAAFNSHSCPKCGKPKNVLVTKKGQYCSYCGYSF